MNGIYSIALFFTGLIIGIGLGLNCLKEEVEGRFIEEIKQLKYHIKHLETSNSSKKPPIPIVYP